MVQTKAHSPENYFQNPIGIPSHDYIENTYDNSGNLIKTTFKRGGSTGTEVGNLFAVYNSQGLLLGSYFYKGTYDTDAFNYIKAVETADGKELETDIRIAINDFVVRCKTYGIWDSIKASCLMIGARTLAGALIPLKGSAPTNYNFVSGDYQRANGLKGDGTSKYLDSNKLDDAPSGNSHVSVFVNRVSTSNEQVFIGNGFTDVGTTSITFVNNVRARRSRNSGSSDANGYFYNFMGLSRTSSSVANERINNNDFVINQTEQTPPNKSFNIFGHYNPDGSPRPLTEDAITFYSIGESLNLEHLDNTVSELVDEIRNILAFRITVKTDNAGTSNNDQFTLATRSGYAYNYTIDWGDGTVETYNTDSPPTHTYSSAGEYSITIKGIFPTVYFNNGGDVDKIISIDDIGGTWGNTLERAFFGADNIASFDKVGDTSGVTNFNYAWYGCSSLTNFPELDTSSGTNFSRTWQNCSSLTSFPLIDTSSGISFSETWRGCISLTGFPLIDTSSVTGFYSTWQNCSGLTSFPLIDTSSVTSFVYTWRGCISLTGFPLIDTSSVTQFYGPWNGCSSLTSFPLLNTSSGTNFIQAWYNCNSLTSFPANFFDNWIGIPVTNCFVQTWVGCTSLTAQSVENILVSIDTSGVAAPASGTNIDIDYNVSTGSLSSATTTAITNLKGKGWTPTINGVLQ